MHHPNLSAPRSFISRVRTRAAAILPLLVASLIIVGLAGIVPASPAHASSSPGIIEAGSGLFAGTSSASVTSPNGGFQLQMQGDGNLVAYLDPAVYGGSDAVWDSGTWGHPGAFAVMQCDGNLVVYSGGHALWSSKTGGHPCAHYYAYMQRDGNLVIYNGSPFWYNAIWQSHTYGGTTTHTTCHPSQSAFGGVTVCFSATVWHNDVHAGVLSSSDISWPQCSSYGIFTSKMCTGSPTRHSSIGGGGHSIDGVNQMVTDTGGSFNTYTCVDLRIDSDPHGNAVSANLPTSEPFWSLSPTCH